MFGIDDFFLATFLEAVPEMFAATEGATALTAATEATAAAEAAAAAQAAQAAQVAQAAQAAQTASSGILQAANPELLQSVANFAPETSILGPESSGILQNVNPELLDSVAKFAPETSMNAANSVQLASAEGGYNGIAQEAMSQVPPAQAPLPQAPSAPDIPTPKQIGNYPGGSELPETLDADTFPTPKQTGSYPGGSTEPTVSNFRNAVDIQTEGQSPLTRGFNKALEWIDKNPYPSAALAYAAYASANKPEPYVEKPYDGPLSKYKLSSNFKGSQANPQNFQYTPTQYKYASGGITGYAGGGVSHPDVGIYHDSDPDTMYLDPLTAAMVRQSKLDSRSYVNTKAKFKEPTRMGTLNFKPVAGSAQGGIMQAQRYDEGGVTGNGNIDLHIPVNIGGGGGGGGGGKYDGFGGGFGGGGGGGFEGGRMGGGGYNGGGGGGLGGLLGGIGQMFGGMMGGSQGGLQKGQQSPAMYGAAPQTMGDMNYGMGGGYGPMIDNRYHARDPNADMTYSAFAGGGAVPSYDLGGYAAGGNPRLLRGPGDGMSDNIPATINNRQPARLADGEFVVPADVVSHLGNGSTEAGAKKLHKMMNEVRKARTGNPKQGKQINPNKYMPK